MVLQLNEIQVILFNNSADDNDRALFCGNNSNFLFHDKSHFNDAGYGGAMFLYDNSTALFMENSFLTIMQMC